MNAHDPAPHRVSDSASTPPTLAGALWRHRFLVGLCVVAALVPAYLVDRRLPRIYEAETTLVMRNGGENLDPAQLLHASLGRAFLLDLVEELRSRSVAEQVLADLPDAARARLLAEQPASGGDDAHEKLLQHLRRSIQSELLRETDVIRVRTRARDPELAAALANSVGRILGERNLQTKRAELAGLREFIESQVDTVSHSLRASEEEMNLFKQNHGVVTLEKEAEALLERITRVESELHLASTKLKGQKQESAALDAELGRQKGNLPNTAAQLTSPYIGELKRALVDLQVRSTRLQMQDYAPAHPELVKLDRDITATRERIEAELRRLAESSLALDPLNSIPRIVQRRIDLEIDIHALEARTRALGDVRDSYERSLAGFPDKELVLMRLMRTNMLNEKIYLMLVEKREEARIAEAARVGNVRVLDAAVPPRTPLLPRTRLNLLLAGVLGLLAGTSLAVHRDRNHRVVRTPQDLRSRTTIPVLGAVPRVEGKRLRHSSSTDAFPLLVRGSRLRAQYGPTAAGESYRSLRTALLHLGPEGPPRTILITSPGPREGKTTTSLNLGISLAMAGIPTCLVDADMRRPSLHTAFGVDLDPGFATALERGGSLLPALEHQTRYANLSLVSAGRSAINPVELLERPATPTFLAHLARRHRVVLVDSPPVIPVADQIILARHADIVLLVVHAGTTRFEALDHAIETLRRGGVRHLHLVLNGVTHPDYYGKYTRYYREYVSSAARASA